MAKQFKDTGVGQFLSSKGFDSVLNAVGTFVPGVKILSDVKSMVLGTPEYKQMTPEDQQTFLQLHQAEMEMLDKQLADVANARSREVEVAKTGKKDWMMMATGMIGLISFAFLIYVTVFVNIPVSNKDLFNILLGNVMGVALTIFTYYFGSSKGSSDKTNLMANNDSVK